MKLIVSLDCAERGDKAFMGVVLVDGEGKMISPQPDLEVRDYSRGSTEDDGGALYEDVSADY